MAAHWRRETVTADEGEKAIFDSFAESLFMLSVTLRPCVSKYLEKACVAVPGVEPGSVVAFIDSSDWGIALKGMIIASDCSLHWRNGRYARPRGLSRLTPVQLAEQADAISSRDNYVLIGPYLFHHGLLSKSLSMALAAVLTRLARRVRDLLQSAPPTPSPVAGPDQYVVAENLSRLADQAVAQIMPLWANVWPTKIHSRGSIPERKLAEARKACKVPANEEVWVLIDGTEWGSARRCLLLAKRGIYVRNTLLAITPGEWFVPWKYFAEASIFSRGTGGSGDVHVGCNVLFEYGVVDCTEVARLLIDVQTVLNVFIEHDNTAE